MSANIVDTTTLKSRDPRDPVFYFTLVTFKVEDTLFRVPRHPFKLESEVFEDMFALPPSGELADGMSDEKPLLLQGIIAKDFAALLRVLFDPAHGAQGDLSQDEWKSVLHLTHMWNFGRLFSLSIEKLEALPVDPVTKILLAKTYDITKWLRAAYFALAMREDHLTLEESKKLGMDTAVKLNEVREVRYKWIIEDGDVRPFQSGWNNNFANGRRLEDQYTGRLEAAVHSALSDVFDL